MSSTSLSVNTLAILQRLSKRDDGLNAVPNAFHPQLEADADDSWRMALSKQTKKRIQKRFKRAPDDQIAKACIEDKRAVSFIKPSIVTKAKDQGSLLAESLAQNESQKLYPATIEQSQIEQLLQVNLCDAGDGKTRLLLLQLQTAVMADMLGIEPTTITPEKKGWKAKLPLYLILAAGTLFMAGEGFDGINSMLSLLNAPFAAVAVVGAFFAMVSVLVFYGFEVNQISQHLGIGLQQSGRALDSYLLQLKLVKQFRATLAERLLEANEQVKYDALMEQFELLKRQSEPLADIAATYERARNALWLRITKKLASCVAGILFFSSGFFTGQALAVTIIGLTSLSAATGAGAGIIFAVAAVVGLCALAIYWFVERPALENIVSRLFGCDTDKIKKLSEKTEVLEKTLNECQQLFDEKDVELQLSQQQVEEKEDLERKNRDLERKNRGLLQQKTVYVPVFITGSSFFNSGKQLIDRSLSQHESQPPLLLSSPVQTQAVSSRY